MIGKLSTCIGLCLGVCTRVCGGVGVYLIYQLSLYKCIACIYVFWLLQSKILAYTHKRERENHKNWLYIYIYIERERERKRDSVWKRDTEL